MRRLHAAERTLVTRASKSPALVVAMICALSTRRRSYTSLQYVPLGLVYIHTICQKGMELVIMIRVIGNS
jgi:hypothetical protein